MELLSAVSVIVLGLLHKWLGKPTTARKITRPVRQGALSRRPDVLTKSDRRTVVS